MTKNPILDELRSVREELLAEAGGTLEGLVAKIQADQESSGRTVRKSRRTIACTRSDGGEVLQVENVLPPPPASGN